MKNKQFRKKTFGAIIVLICLIFLAAAIRLVQADELLDIAKQIEDLARARELSVAATKPLEEEVKKIEAQISDIERRIKAYENKLNELETSIADREEDLAFQYDLLSVRIRGYYKRSKHLTPILIFFSSTNASEIARNITYQAAAADEDKKIIVKVTNDLIQLEKDKNQAEEDRKRLASLQGQLNKEAEFFRGEIANAKGYQEELSGKIATLTARQQEILTAKVGTFQTSVGDVPLADDPNARPDFNPGFSPAFAAFSFGAPHYKGMSQYGAFGRAKNGQSAETILKAYYGDGIEIKKDYSTDITIQVEGYGSYNIEEYVKRIYEMPSSWTDNDSAALKAQAVAARSYALARTNNGASSICATEACQVFKPDPKGGAWDAAVNNTRGWVLVANGQPFSAWYASTSGGYQESYGYNGYSTPGFWDAEGGRSGWTSQAWEVKGGSPWFYKGWYKTRSGDTCGRNHPWLNMEEMADILNGWEVLQGGSDDRVSPIGPCWSGNPYSIEELRNKGGYTSISSVSVVYADNGVTSSVTFDTNKGSRTITGSEFKKVFNLRAPGWISLKSGLFNIEKK